MISVLLPTRKRPDLLRRSVKSLFDNATKSVEVLIGCDDDDKETIPVFTELSEQYPGRVCLQLSPRHGYAHLYKYYNSLAELSRGQWIMLWNDDAVMTTQGWDDRIEELPESVLVGDLQSNMSADGWICFPAIRRSLYEVLGYFSLPNPHVDSYVQDLGRALGIVGTVDVWIEHNRPDLTGETPDVTFLEGRAGLDHVGYFSPEFQARITADAERVRTAFSMAGPVT